MEVCGYPAECCFPFYFYRAGKGGIVEFIVIIAKYSVTNAEYMYGVEMIMEKEMEILRPDIDLYEMENVHIFSSERAAREFIRDWWKEEV
jgi:hypothetical protein